MPVTTSTPTPKLKLTYFDGPWLGEPIRNAFIIGGVEFEDHRVKKEDWMAMKPSTPFGALPILTVDDDKVYSQSDAILRYAGKLTGLYPECPMAAMKVDEILGGTHDLILAVMSDRSEEGTKKALEEGIPRYAGALDKLYAANTTGPYILGDQITIADLKLSFIACMFPKMDSLNEKVFDEYTHLLAANKAVLSKVAEMKGSK